MSRSGLKWFEDFASDAKYGLRSLARSPQLALAAMLSLGLAVGINTTIFSLFRAICGKEVTATEPERLMRVKFAPEARQINVSFPDYKEIRETGAFADLAGFSTPTTNWRVGADTRRLETMVVTANFFDLLGVRAGIGRVFTAQEAQEQRDPRTAVISHELWRELGADPGVLGSVVGINGQPFILIGVLPSDFHAVTMLGLSPQLYVPFSTTIAPRLHDRSEQGISLLGRLRPGSTAQATQAALAPITQYLKHTYPKEDDGFSYPIVYAVTGIQAMQQEGATIVLGFFAILLGLVGIVVLIACVNISGLLIARAAARAREIAVRLALGAGRSRLLRQLLTESLQLAVVSMAFGLVLRAGFVRLISQVQLPMPVPIKLDLSADWQLGAYALALTVSVTILCGVLPARHATQLDLISVLKQADASYGFRRLRLSRFLVSIEVGATAVLLVIAFLFVHSLVYLSAMNPGFDLNHTARIQINSQEANNNPARGLRVVQLLDRLRAVPGVQGSTCASTVPLSMSFGNSVVFKTKNTTAAGDTIWIGPSYFATMGISRLSGREFEVSDGQGVAVMNETLARRLFANRSPLGESITIEGSKNARSVQIVGVVRDSKYVTLGEASHPVLFLPYLEIGQTVTGIDLFVRTAGEPSKFASPLREAVQEFDRTAFVKVNPMKDNLATVLLPSRIGALLVGIYGILALALATVGVYGLVAYSVTRRTSEIGVRMALGATRGDILEMILRDAVIVIGTGGVLGLLVALALAQLLGSLLPAGISTSDPATFGGVFVVLLGIAAVAPVIPATRAMRLEPMRALRHE